MVMRTVKFIGDVCVTTRTYTWYNLISVFNNINPNVRGYALYNKKNKKYYKKDDNSELSILDIYSIKTGNPEDSIKEYYISETDIINMITPTDILFSE